MPNYAGLFLRGQGGNAAAIGVMQGDAMRNYDGKGQIYGGHDTRLMANGVFRFLGRWGISAFGGSHRSTTANAYELDISPASHGVPVASEIRPINTAVRYLIRALP